jgi:hypothetical protein
MLTHRQHRATVMASAGSPSMPLFGVDTGLRRTTDGVNRRVCINAGWYKVSTFQQSFKIES